MYFENKSEDLGIVCTTGLLYLNKKLEVRYLPRGPFCVAHPHFVYTTGSGCILGWDIPIINKNFHCSRYYGSGVRITLSSLYAESPVTGCILVGMVTILPQSVMVALSGLHLS